MSGREKEKEVEAPRREGNQGICIKCQRLLPISVMGKDAFGCPTAWCDACRDEVAKNWGVDRDLVEWVRCMCTFERHLAAEAETVMSAMVHQERALPGELIALRNRIHTHNLIRHSRIRDKIRHALTEYREQWFYSIGMELPRVDAEIPTGSDALV